LDIIHFIEFMGLNSIGQTRISKGK